MFYYQVTGDITFYSTVDKTKLLPMMISQPIYLSFWDRVWSYRFETRVEFIIADRNSPYDRVIVSHKNMTITPDVT